MNPSDLFESLQNWTNQLSQSWLALDPKVRQRLNQCAGQTVEIECTRPSLTAHVNLHRDHVTVHHGPATAPNVQLRGSAPALLGRALADNGHAGVDVNGDETLLLELLDILRSYRPDLAPILAKVFGDETAQTLTAIIELGSETALQFTSNQFHELLHTSRRAMQHRFAAQAEADELHSQLDQLRLRIDRTAARIQHLEQSSRRSSLQ